MSQGRGKAPMKPPVASKGIESSDFNNNQQQIRASKPPMRGPRVQTMSQTFQSRPPSGPSQAPPSQQQPQSQQQPLNQQQGLNQAPSQQYNYNYASNFNQGGQNRMQGAPQQQQHQQPLPSHQQPQQNPNVNQGVSQQQYGNVNFNQGQVRQPVPITNPSSNISQGQGQQHRQGPLISQGQAQGQVQGQSSQALPLSQPQSRNISSQPLQSQQVQQQTQPPLSSHVSHNIPSQQIPSQVQSSLNKPPLISNNLNTNMNINPNLQGSNQGIRKPPISSGSLLQNQSQTFNTGIFHPPSQQQQQQQQVQANVNINPSVSQLQNTSSPSHVHQPIPPVVSSSSLSSSSASNRIIKPLTQSVISSNINNDNKIEEIDNNNNNNNDQTEENKDDVNTNSNIADVNNNNIVSNTSNTNPTIKKAPVIRSKPWQIFTGDDKPDPIIAGWARVRQISSGDSLTLAIPSTNKNNSSHQIVFVLEGVKAPRAQRKPEDKEEPFGYDAREYVRNLIGLQQVFFAAWNEVKDAIPARYYGDIYIGQGSDRLSLSQLVVANGWADVKESYNLTQSEYTKLKSLENEAKKQGKGKFSSLKNRLRKLNVYKTKEERIKFCDKFKNKELDAIVDQVRDGSTLRLEIIPDDHLNHHIIFINLAGCSAPSLPFVIPNNNKNNDNNNNNKTKEMSQAKIDPFAIEAKEYSEARLNGQKVKVILLAHDNQGNIYGTIKHQLGNISLLLLKNGLAEYVQWSALLIPDIIEREILKHIDQESKQKKIGIWKHRIPEVSNDESMICTVTRIVSGDTIYVKRPDGVEERFTLASIRAPKLGVENKENKEDKSKRNEPHAMEAKEFLRKKLIGQQVDLYKDYEFESTNENMKKLGFEKQKFATIILNGENIAVSLVKNGLAIVTTHKKEAPRSRDYDKLLQASKLGNKKVKDTLQQSQPPPPPQQSSDKSIQEKNIKQKEKENREEKMYDLSKDSQITAREYQSIVSVLKSGKKNAVVEHIFSGNRLKLYFHDRKVYIPLVLFGIKCPSFRIHSGQGIYSNAIRKNENKYEDEIGEEAYNYLKDNVYQRDVQVEIKEVPLLKTANQQNNPHEYFNNNFIGIVYFNDKSLADELVEKGLAKVTQPYIKRIRGNKNVINNEPKSDPERDKLYHLESIAKKNHLGWWKYEEEVDIKEDVEDGNKKSPNYGKEISIQVSFVESPICFFIHENNGKIQEMEDHMSKLQKIPINKVEANSNKLVAAIYDGLYCRARIIGRPFTDKIQSSNDNKDSKNNNNNNKKDWMVYFIDYGNRSVINEKDMVALPPELSIKNYSQLAQRCLLAGLEAPLRQEYKLYHQAGHFFGENILNKDLKIKILYEDINEKNITAWHVDLIEITSDHSLSINKMMVGEGYVKLNYNDIKEYEKDEDAYIQNYITDIKKLKEIALHKHLGVWEYGEVEPEQD